MTKTENTRRSAGAGSLSKAAQGWLAENAPETLRGHGGSLAVDAREMLAEYAEGKTLTELGFPEPLDAGIAQPSDLADHWYVRDIIRPGRITLWAAEEGSGKTMSLNGEIAVRFCTDAGGSFAETWPVEASGNMLILSEMHADDCLAYETMALTSLERTRDALTGRLYRLNVETAASGDAPLDSPEWTVGIVGWMREHGIKILVIDTVTSASDKEVFGTPVSELYRTLRSMIDALPNLAIVLVVHFKKPQGRSGNSRGLSDVLGQLGRRNDITILQQNDGPLGERAKISNHKRVGQHRMVIATKRGGLLVDPMSATTAGQTKVSQEGFLAVLAENPGISQRALATKIGVTPSTVAKYAKEAGDAVRTEFGPNRSTLYYPTTTGEARDTALNWLDEYDQEDVA